MADCGHAGSVAYAGSLCRLCYTSLRQAATAGHLSAGVAAWLERLRPPRVLRRFRTGEAEPALPKTAPGKPSTAPGPDLIWHRYRGVLNASAGSSVWDPATGRTVPTRVYGKHDCVWLSALSTRADCVWVTGRPSRRAEMRWGCRHGFRSDDYVEPTQAEPIYRRSDADSQYQAKR